MERLIKLKQEHKNCSTKYCYPCTAINYFDKRDYYMSMSYFFRSQEFELVDMLIFENFIQHTKAAIKNEFIPSWLIGIELFRRKEYDKAIKYLDYASSVDNVKSAHETLGSYYQKNNIEESMKYYYRYILALNEEDLKKGIDSNLIFRVALFYFEKNNIDKVLDIINYIDKKENWILAYLNCYYFNINEKIYKILTDNLSNDIIQYSIKPFFADYISSFQNYDGQEQIYLTFYEKVLEKFETEFALKHKEQLNPLKKFHQPLLILYNKACNNLGKKYENKGDYNKSIYWFEKAYNYVKITECYIIMKNKENIIKYSEFAIQNNQYKIYTKLIDFYISENEYEKALSQIRICFEQFEKFSKGIYELYKKSRYLSLELKQEIFLFVRELIQKLEKIRNENDFYNIPIHPEDVSPLFYSIAKFYKDGFGCDKNKREYKKNMKFGNNWSKLFCKYNPEFAEDILYDFEDDENFKGYDSEYDRD
jgi:hypothetical protein